MNVEETLKEFRINYEKKPEYFEVLCPFHNDTNPSGRIHHKTAQYNCFVCNKHTTIVSYLARWSNLPLYQIKSKIGFRSDCKNPIPPTEVEYDHEQIWKHRTFLDELYHRTLTNEDIRYYRLGVKDLGNEKRISIPIPNDIGEYGNLRLYIPGALERKFLNLTGKDRSRVRLYPIEQLEYDQILVCGGELKAIAAAKILNKYDIGAISPTCGENIWPNELNDRFLNKLIYVNCDVDEIGQRWAEIRCRILKAVAREVHKVILTPESVGNDPKGDLNDFIRLGGDLYNLLLNTSEWRLIPGGELAEEEAESITFREAYSHESTGKRVIFTAVIAGVNNNNFLVPSAVEVRCGRNEDFCSLCDVNSQAFTDKDATSTGTVMKIGKEHQTTLALINEEVENHYKIYKRCFKIPQKCRQCIFEPKQTRNVTEVRLDEQLDPTSREEPLTQRPAYIVNNISSIDQQTYNITGRLYPSPKNQIATILASDIQPTQDALDSYQPADIRELEVFQPDEWTYEGIDRKLNQIYTDLEANVTKVYQRTDYHIAIDLVYCSILHFNFGEIKDINGWLEFLAVGDTGQAKSKTVQMLAKHYGLGHKIDCKSVTLPGLTIGIDKYKNFMVYGAMPRNDKRLIIFEELLGMDPKIFQKLTEVRSSGNVQITKINTNIRRARVRMIAISNPPPKREVSSYTFGIQAAVSIIGTHEDLRRFDFMMIIGKNDIDAELYSQQQIHPPQAVHQYTDDLCQRLILRAWKCERVEFQDTNFVIEATKRLVAIFGDGPPILDPNTSHLKIAKLSAALAARTNSYENNILIVRRCHSEYIEKFLHRIYTATSCKLDEHSKAVKESIKLRDRQGLVTYLKGLSNTQEIMIKISESDEITGNFVRELCGDFYQGSTLFARLIQSNAIMRAKGDRYVKTAEFTQMLQTTEWKINIPPHIQQEIDKGK